MIWILAPMSPCHPSIFTIFCFYSFLAPATLRLNFLRAFSYPFLYLSIGLFCLNLSSQESLCSRVWEIRHIHVPFAPRGSNGNHLCLIPHLPIPGNVASSYIKTPFHLSETYTIIA